MPDIKYKEYPENKAAQVWEYKGFTLSVTHGGTFFPHYCGYARFNVPVIIPKDIDQKVYVHGGITYNQGGVLGFDCMHVGDESNPDCQNLKWVMRETERMADQLVTLYVKSQGA